jgi:hypothetical protein
MGYHGDEWRVKSECDQLWVTEDGICTSIP